MEYDVWVTLDEGGEGTPLTLSRKRLGNFVFWLHWYGGSITGSHAKRPRVRRSHVQMVILLPKSRKDALERASGFTLVAPEDEIPNL